MSNSGRKTTDDDEVEQILRAAQDDVLLKLNLNSHVARAPASAAIDPDLDRRFEALKRSPKPTEIDDPVKKVPANIDTGAASKVGGAASDDDLFARFAVLKNSIPSHNRNEIKSNFPSDVSVNQEVREEESEDEVEKVIKWAIDAARLDPSPPSDDDDNDDGSDDDDDDGDDHGVDGGKKSKRK